MVSHQQDAKNGKRIQIAKLLQFQWYPSLCKKSACDMEMVLANPQAPPTGLSRPSPSAEQWQSSPAAPSYFTHRAGHPFTVLIRTAY